MPLTAEAYAALHGPPTSFVIDNDLYEVLPDEWWPALRTVQLSNPWAFSFLLGVTQEDDGIVLAERLVSESDPLDQVDLVPVAERLVELATGRKWWVAARLAMIVDGSWGALDGRLSARGVDLLLLLKTQPSRALNIVHAMLYEHADEKRTRELDVLIDRPPVAALKQRRTVSEDAAAFENAFTAGASL